MPAHVRQAYARFSQSCNSGRDIHWELERAKFHTHDNDHDWQFLYTLHQLKYDTTWWSCPWNMLLGCGAIEATLCSNDAEADRMVSRWTLSRLAWCMPWCCEWLAHLFLEGKFTLPDLTEAKWDCPPPVFIHTQTEAGRALLRGEANKLIGLQLEKLEEWTVPHTDPRKDHGTHGKVEYSDHKEAKKTFVAILDPFLLSLIWFMTGIPEFLANTLGSAFHGHKVPILIQRG